MGLSQILRHRVVKLGLQIDEAGYVNLRTGFGERKEGGSQSDLCILPEHFLGKMIKRLLEVRKTYVPVDIQAFNLMEETMGAGRDRLVAIHTTWHDRADGWLLLFHQPDLHV